MDIQIRERWNITVLTEAARRYGIAADQIRPLDAFESFIFEYQAGPRAYILRIAHSLRRTEALIQGEAEWINFLAEGGVGAARAVPSCSGSLVETIPDGQGGSFLATAFEKAAGHPPWDLWSPRLYETYGELIGRMHARSKDYQPSNPALRRPDWDADLFEFVERYLPVSESAAVEKYRALKAAALRLPRSRDVYGLIHQDAHGSNLLVDQAGQITLFDFDECAYSWFINEIAIVLFYIVQDAEDAPTFTAEFLTHFLRGYTRACPLDRTWLAHVPLFLKLRELEMYAVLHRDFDVENIDNEWCARFMRGRKKRIEQDQPFIDFDFSAFSESAIIRFL